PIIVCATRPDGLAIFFNHEWYDYTGMTEEQSLREGWMRALHPDDFTKTLTSWRVAINKAAAFKGEIRLRRRDGSYRWFLARLNPVHDSSRGVVRWFGTCSDIDDQKRNEVSYARLYERERRIADTLQRALLPPVLPRVPGLTLDAVYQPDTDEAKVGGDWYDAFDLGDGRIALSIGDVGGHGLEAAVLMGRVREAIRAAAIEEQDPSHVLRLANATVELAEPNTIVTALFAVLDRLTMELSYASAGHPPPLLALPDGRIVALENPDIPLGCGLPPGTAEWTSHDVMISPGSILAFYTDGLIEADRDLLGAEERMRAALERQARGTQQRSALSLVASTIVGAQRDDIAVLTVATSATPVRDIEFTLPCNAFAARRARHMVARMLREAGVPSDRGFDLLVAVGEAANNAVEHAAKLGGEHFSIRARRRPAAITVEIADRGAWTPKFE
ncbi:MAG: ATP-binding SpoIIE family protein phosphatase, partial [Vulcanimicrobiaceae bacterium]